MGRARAEDLWSRTLASIPLLAHERRALEEAFAADPWLRRQAAVDAGVHAALRELARDEESHERFAARFVDLCRAENEGEDFVRRMGRRLRRETRARWPWVPALAAAAAVVAVVAVVLVRRGGRAPEETPTAVAPAPVADGLASVIELRGQPRLVRAGRAAPLTGRTRLEVGDRVETGAAGVLGLLYAGAARLELGEDAVLALDGAAPPSPLPANARAGRLERGRLMADVDPLPGGRPLLFITPHARALILGARFGTRFALTVDAGGTGLAVQEGRVLFEQPGRRMIEVGAGQQALAAASEEAPTAGPAADAAPAAP